MLVLVWFGERQFIPDEVLPYFDVYYFVFITALQHPAPPIFSFLYAGYILNIYLNFII